MIKKLKIGNRVISDKNKPLVIAEISANHQNSLKTTFKLLKKTAEAGVEIVKFQTFNLDDMTLNINKREFLIKNNFKNKQWNSRSLYNIYKEAHLPFKWHKRIFKRAKSLGLMCFSSVFDLTSLKLLEQLKSPAYKIASLESLHFPLIKEVCKTKKPIIISTGTLSIIEIEEIIKFFKKINYKKYILLHCISNYPTKNKDVNLAFIKYLKNKYKCLVGFSDHTDSLGAAISSVAYGACVIEKHVKLKDTKKSLDHQFSINTDEMKKMIVETNNAWEAIGKPKKIISSSEKNIKKYRRSIYSSKIIKKGEYFTKNNIKVIRPGYGLEPKYYYYLLGKKAKRKINFGQPISFSLVSSSS